MNRPFRVPPSLCIKTRGSSQLLIWKWFFIVVQIKLIFTRKFVRLASFWKWGFLELGSGLLKHDVWYSFTRIAKTLAVKYITVVPLLNTKNSSFTDSSLGPLTCKTSDNLNFYNTNTSVMRMVYGRFATSRFAACHQQGVKLCRGLNFTRKWIYFMM